MVVDYRSIDDRVVHTDSTLHHTLAVRGKIIGPLRLLGIDRIGIEDRDIRGIAGAQQTTPLQTED